MSAAPQIDSTSEFEIPQPRAEHGRRFDPFRVLSAGERRRQMDAYLAHLRERDGEMDFPGRTLSRREGWVATLERDRIEWGGAVDTDAFYQHLFNVASPALDERGVWLVAAAKANQMESWGVEREIAKWVRRGYSDENEILLYDLLEEQYHTRILQEVCVTAGLGGVNSPTPNALMRGFTYVMMYFPDQLRYIPIAAGEILGSVIFGMLLENTKLFSEEPEVEERLRALLSEVILDETGHILYCRAHMEPWALRLTRRTIPWMVDFILKDVPQLRTLGLDRRELRRRLQAGIAIPSQFDWLEEDLVG